MGIETFKPSPSSYTLAPNGIELLRITDQDFFVRGVKVEQGPGEAKQVYEAFLNFLQIKR